MKQQLLTFFLYLFCVGASWAQTINMGGPISWKEETLKNREVQMMVLPAFDQAAINAEDVISDQTKDHPWRFGYKHATNYTLDETGTWATLPNGDRVWRLGFSCEGAMTINLLLENVFLPEGASLYLFDIENTNRVGAYTSKNNREDGLLGTELVHGDHIILEYVEPSAVAGQGRFTVASVIHGYRSLNPIQKSLERALHSSGDCNIDVNCPLGNGWEDQIRSVAMIIVNGNGVCTGALVNNTCNDGTPYFLTANHCLSASTGNWAFRFNWESPAGTESCATSDNSTDPGPPYDETANGCTVLVNGNEADHALLQIDNMTLAEAQSWNVFYAGWNNNDTDGAITQGTGIHHPSGDLKKICREDNSPYHATSGLASVWYINQWEQGTTEGGSSGSPLFDQNKRIIGQLYGGTSSCSGTSGNGQYDVYGRLGVSWGLGIGSYLAPTSCVNNATTDDGWDPNYTPVADDAGITDIVSPVGIICADKAIPEVTLKNFGSNDITTVTINYNVDGGANNTHNWSGTLAPGTSTVITLPVLNLTNGSHVFNAYTTQPNGNADGNNANDTSTVAFSAVVGGQEVLIEIDTDCWGAETTWEIQDASSAVLYSGGPYPDVVGGAQFSKTVCLTPGCYDFIFSDSGNDGVYGSQYSTCSVDGNYKITQVENGVVLDTMLAVNGDFGAQEINNFCVLPPCPGTDSLSAEVENITHVATTNDGAINISATDGGGAYTYNWTGPSGFTSSDEDPSGLAPGTYAVTITDICGAVTELNNIVVEDHAGLEEAELLMFEVYPNPSEGMVNVQLSGLNISYTVSLLDVTGRVVYTEEQNSKEFSIDLKSMANGTYLLHIASGNIQSTQRVVLKK